MRVFLGSRAIAGACIVIGAIFTSIGILAFTTNLLEGWFEARAFMLTFVGIGFCVFGLGLRGNKRH